MKYDNVRKIATDQGNFYCKMIAIGLSKPQALDADPKAIQQINLTANLDWDGNTAMFFINEEAKKTFLIFHRELLKYCKFILL